MTILIRSTACVLFLIATQAFASLGDAVETVEADRAWLQAESQITEGAGFAVYALRLQSGTIVREYVSPSGMVFAVTWQGPELPDLQQLLGRYFGAYGEALNAQRASGARASRTAELVVQIGGHMRAYAGRVFVPGMLPRGMAETDIR